MNLKLHINSVHEGIKNHKCDLCQKAFSHRGKLKNHINTVHEGLKNHKCYICEKAFSQAVNLRNHINNIHKGLRKEFDPLDIELKIETQS